MRYCWGYRDFYLNVLPRPLRSIANSYFEKLKEWDIKTIDNVDKYIANSSNVADRVKKYYNKKASVCYPPIDLDLFIMSQF